MEKEFVILVDKHDQEIGLMEKMEAHEKALLHWAISVCIFNSQGEWLLQRRALSKYHSGGLWANTCCTHPKPNETSEEAAHRRLQQEMGMESEIKELFSFTYKEALDHELSEHEIDHVFVGVTNQKPVINVDEVDSYKYISYEDLEKDINSNPQNYTVWFKEIYKKINHHKSKLVSL